MKKFLLTALAAAALSPAMAQASITINSAFGILNDANHNPLAVSDTIVATDPSNSFYAGSTYSIIADMNGDGFGDLTQATSSWTAGADDVLLYRNGLNGFAVGAGSTFESIQINSPAQIAAAGKAMMLVFYDLPFNPSDVGPGQGIDFGTFRTDAPNEAEGSQIGWFVPANAATWNLNILTESLGGAASDTQYFTNQTTVPEPASLVLLALGGLVVAARRRHA